MATIPPHPTACLLQGEKCWSDVPSAVLQASQRTTTIFRQLSREFMKGIWVILSSAYNSHFPRFFESIIAYPPVHRFLHREIKKIHVWYFYALHENNQHGSLGLTRVLKSLFLQMLWLHDFTCSEKKYSMSMFWKWRQSLGPYANTKDWDF